MAVYISMVRKVRRSFSGTGVPGLCAASGAFQYLRRKAMYDFYQNQKVRRNDYG